MMAGRVNYSGLVIAGIGFFLTRFTVTLAIYENPLRFYLAGVVPLVLGLGLAAFGVALAVADVETSLVRTTAIWCVIGFGAMLVLVLLTLLGSTQGGMPDFASARSRTYLSNFLIGGSVGGTMTGLYASHTRRQRWELDQQASRLDVLNRLLRHEILNSVAVIRGYASLDGAADTRDVIETKSDAIERTIEQVKYLARGTGANSSVPGDIDLGPRLTASVETVRNDHPNADISVETPETAVRVRATDRLDEVLTNLLENAIVHADEDDPSVDVSVSVTGTAVRIGVSDRGPGLPESQRTLLETGAIEEFDNPAMGFGLNVVRLLVESFDGSLETDVAPDGTTVTVVLDRARVETGGQPIPASLGGVRPAAPHLLVTLGAALIAGIVYGIVAEQLGGSIAFIGIYYGVQDSVVGWITHEFHSVVFAFVFAGLVSLLPSRYARDTLLSGLAYLVVGVGWGVVLWVVAAGIVSPVWLNLVGIPAEVPNLTLFSLVNHAAWGATLGLLTAFGYRFLAPRLARLRTTRLFDRPPSVNGTPSDRAR